MAFFHAYKFTHFAVPDKNTAASHTSLSFTGKIKALLFGVSNLRPVNEQVPSRPFTTVVLQSNKKISCWHVKVEQCTGTVILFHGYNSNKASMLGQAEEFNKAGYSTFLVDFMGSGESEGNETTIGIKEAEEVKTCFDHIAGQGEKAIFLYGISMGAVAMMKAIYDYDIAPKGIIIECPFSTLYKTVCARFHMIHVPAFPMAGLLTFWGGAQHGFWAFSHEPIRYAEKIKCPTLLLYGLSDPKVSKKETLEIYEKLQGPKKYVFFPNTGHENYLLKNKDTWTKETIAFLKTYDN